MLFLTFSYGYAIIAIAHLTTQSCLWVPKSIAPLGKSMSVPLSRNYQMNGVASRKRAPYTPRGLCSSGSENINKLSAVPGGTRERVRGNSYER